MPSFGACVLSRTVTVNNAKVASTLTGFPVLVSGTFDGTSGNPDLRTIANGGKANSVNDVQFFSDSGCTTKIPWQPVVFDAVNGVDEFWVLPATVSTSNSPFYIDYGDATHTTDQSNAAGVWGSLYAMVLHMQTTSPTDSTSNAITITNHSATAVAGKIGGALASSVTTWVSFPDATFPTTGAFTMSGWFKSSTSDTSNIIYSYGNGSGAATQVYLGFYDLGNGHVAGIFGCAFLNVGGAVDLNDGVWHLLHGTFSGGVGTMKLYVDGVFIASSAAVISVATGNTATVGRDDTGGAQTFIGSNDEIHEATFEQSADWIAAEWNNQNSPSTFIAFGSEVNSGGAALPSIGGFIY